MTDPVINGSMTIAVDDAPATAAGLFLVGFQGPVTGFGLGCNVHVDLALPTIPLSFKTDASGSARLQLKVPNNATLKGFTVVWQAGVVAPGGGPLGLALTNAVVTTGGN